jgi:hypothetical protein
MMRWERLLAEDLKRADHLGNLRPDKSMILNRIVEKHGVRMRTGLNWLWMTRFIEILVNTEMNHRVP